MRMRQSLAQFEAAFEEEAFEERERLARRRQQAAQRSRVRRSQRDETRSTLRFVGLVATILLTAVVVTIIMFETLTLLIGP
jgi:hypothetical protein